MRAAALTVLRGFCMGAADIVPGVSGGTVALVLGTLVFGTVDRRHTVSAGFRGFRERNLSSYQRLEQRPYRRAMFSSWHWGGHMGWTNRVFAAEHLAPLLRQSEPPKRCE